MFFVVYLFPPIKLDQYKLLLILEINIGVFCLNWKQVYHHTWNCVDPSSWKVYGEESCVPQAAPLWPASCHWYIPFIHSFHLFLL